MSLEAASQGLIIKDDRILMVRQEEDGRIFWNFPGGHMEIGETPEETCIREVKEETGYKIKIIELFSEIAKGSHPGSTGHEYVFKAEIIEGVEKLETGLLGLEWVSIYDSNIWDSKTLPIVQLLRKE
jgi:8-oxo-dGTP diphosphatase